MGAIEETERPRQEQFDISVSGILRNIRTFLPVVRAQAFDAVMSVSPIDDLHGNVSNGVSGRAWSILTRTDKSKVDLTSQSRPGDTTSLEATTIDSRLYPRFPSPPFLA